MGCCGVVIDPMRPGTETIAAAENSGALPWKAAAGKASPAGISWVWHLVNFSPFLLLMWFVSHFATNIPVNDEWSSAPLFYAVKFKKATLETLFAQSNEHRIFFPRLLWTPLAFMTHWNLRVEMMVNLVPALVVFIALYGIALGQAKRTGSIPINLANFTTSLFVFSLVQYGTWLWGIVGSFLFVQAAVALAIWVCTVDKLSVLTRFGVAAIFCVVASYSSAQGLLSWIALVPCIALLQFGRGRALKYCLWILLFAASVALYTYHFTLTEKDLSYFLSHPMQGARFYLALLGAPFCQWTEIFSSMVMASVIGGVVLLAFLLCVALLRGQEPKEMFAPWLSVGLFGLLFTALVTVGRSNEGVLAAIQSRYITGTILVSIATIQLGRLVCPRTGWQVYLFSVGALSALIIMGSAGSVSGARQLKEELSRAKLFVEVLGYIDPAVDDSAQGPVAPLYRGSGARPNAELLNEIGFLHLASGLSFTEQPSEDCGAFESADGSGSLLHLRRSKDEITVSGWASLPGGRGLPKVVLISYGDQRTFIAGAAVGTVSRPDIAARRRDPRYVNAGWKVSFPAQFLPLGEGSLKAWVYDSAEKQFIRIRESGGKKEFNVETH